jgi:hypothetical protein
MVKISPTVKLKSLQPGLLQALATKKDDYDEELCCAVRCCVVDQPERMWWRRQW